MEIKEKLINALEELLTKGATVAGTAFIANNGMQYVIPYVQGDATASVFMQGVVILAGYKVWTLAFVPIITELFESILPKTTKAGKKSDLAARFSLSPI